jgi:peptide/nickel transport system ATP-binding protein/oligopeptide transport system ATP-binding protein
MVEQPLLEVKSLTKQFEKKGGFFSRKKGVIEAVSDVSFEVKEGEVLGLCGESGSGKSTVARLITRLIPKTAGEVYFEQREIFGLKGKELMRFRRSVQIVFQDPDTSLNPRQSLYDTLKEPLTIHRMGEKEERIERMLSAVGLSFLNTSSFPHQLSGGQRQRVAIARALILRPRLLVADEPVSSLDISIAASIINLLSDLKEELGFSIIFISHDLRMVEHIADRVAIMYGGRIAEIAEKDVLFSAPLHPYTKLLIDSIPADHPKRRKRFSLQSESTAKTGCRFSLRCNRAQPICERVEPVMRKVSSSYVACHIYS